MDIEIEVIGKQIKWNLNQSPIRIGRGSQCEVCLSSTQFPSVGLSHGELEIVNDTLRIGPRGPGVGDLFLNEEPAEDGTVILSGDVLRVGADGPELQIVFEERTAPRAAYEPTRVIQASDVPAHDPTRVISAPLPPASAQARSAAPEPRPVRPPTPSVTQVEIPPIPARPPAKQPDEVRVPLSASDRWPDTRRATPRVPVPQRPAPPEPVAAVVASGGNGLDPTMRMMLILQGASLVVILVLVIFIFQLRGDISKNRDEIRSMRAQEQGVLGQLTPALDSRLTVFGQRMDMLDVKMKAGEEQMERGMDEKMKSAEDQLFASLDTKMKSTEDRMVNRMNTELPPLLDKYVNSKLAEMKH